MHTHTHTHTHTLKTHWWEYVLFFILSTLSANTCLKKLSHCEFGQEVWRNKHSTNWQKVTGKMFVLEWILKKWLIVFASPLSAHEAGLVCLQVLESGGSVSSSVLFEYRARNASSLPSSQLDWLSLDGQNRLPHSSHSSQLARTDNTRKKTSKRNTSGCQNPNKQRNQREWAAFWKCLTLPPGLPPPKNTAKLQLLSWEISESSEFATVNKLSQVFSVR